jgi:hypothetical protein
MFSGTPRLKTLGVKVSEPEGTDTEGDTCSAATHINKSSMYFVGF